MRINLPFGLSCNVGIPRKVKKLVTVILSLAILSGCFYGITKLGLLGIAVDTVKAAQQQIQK